MKLFIIANSLKSKILIRGSEIMSHVEKLPMRSASEDALFSYRWWHIGFARDIEVAALV